MRALFLFRFSPRRAKDARDRLRDRQHLRFGHELVKLLRHVGDGAQTSTHDDSEAALFHTVDRSEGCHEAQVVHHHTGTALLPAP